MKKIITLIISVLLILCMLTACGGTDSRDAGTDSSDNTGSADGKLRAVTTIFPIYDWMRIIAGEDNEAADISMLIDTGVDLHSFQPTAEDIKKISECDVFVYVGGESDEWVEDALKETAKKDIVVVNLMEVMGDKALEEELKEGMQEEHEEDEREGDKHEGDKHAGDEETEYDEHIWLSLKNASVLTNAIAEALAEADPDNADTYRSNAQAYIGRLDSLDKEYKKAAESGNTRTLLFGDRFPFRYLTDDYGLDYYAAFVGCSAETEASFETIAFLSAKADELGLRCIMTIEGTDHSIANSIVNNTKTKDQQILTLDSMQGTTAQDVEAGATYLSVMENNLEVLKEALK